MKISKDLMIALYMVGVGLSFNLSSGLISTANATQPPKITICHRTNSDTNPYIKVTVDPDAVDGDTGNDKGNGDHTIHTGPVAPLIDADLKWGDIIPEHDDFVGYNLSTEGLAILNNNCNYPGTNDNCIETVSCSSTQCSTVDSTIQGICGQILCEANAPGEESCPTSCGYAGGTVSNGSCGKTSCEPTQNCEESTPTPTPTPNDDVTISVLDTKCGSDVVSASVHVRHDNVDQSGIRVLFKYIDQEKTAYTGNDGRASVGFAYIVDGHVNILPDGFASKFGYTTKEKNCTAPVTPSNSEGKVLGTSTSGQVLGATTDPTAYAETGVATDILMSIVGISGAALTAAGASLNARKNS